MFRVVYCLSLALWPSLALAGPGGLVAVLPLDAREASINRAMLQTFEEAVRTVAGDELKPRGYTVLTGETTLSVLADNGVDALEACEASCALEAARHLKAKLFISGSIARSEDEYVAFIRLFENENGMQLGSVQIEAATMKEMRHQFATKASSFFARALGEVKAIPAPPAISRPREAPAPPVVAPPAKPRPPADPSIFHFQLGSKDLDGTTVAWISQKGLVPCGDGPLTFGVACQLSFETPGKVRLSVRRPGKSPVEYHSRVASGGSAVELTPQISRRGASILAGTGGALLLVGLTFVSGVIPAGEFGLPIGLLGLIAGGVTGTMGLVSMTGVFPPSIEALGPETKRHPLRQH